MPLFTKVIPVKESDVEQLMAYSIVVPLAGVIKELQLPLDVDADSRSIGIRYDEEDWPDILDKKEAVRSALVRRGLDVMLIRRIMRFIYASSVEEP